MPIFADAIAAFRNRGPARQRSTSDWWYPPVTGYGSVPLTDGYSASYRDIYRGQPWVYAAVNKIARSVARTPLKVYEGPSDDREYVTDGPLYDLLARPWQPYGTPFRFKERLVKRVGIYGVSMVVKLGMSDEASTPTELLPAPSTGWRIGPEGDYVWTSRTGDEYPFKPWQIYRTDYDDCDDDGFGMSMLEPLRMALAVEDAAQRYASAAFRQGARPSSILKSDQSLKPETAERLKAQINAMYGGVDNAFKVAVLEQGLEWAPYPTPNLDDAALVNHRKLTREEVAAVFDVPQSSIGILDESNFASVEAFHTALYQDSLGPWIKLIEETLQAQLVEPTPAFRGLKVEFDMHGLMRGADSSQYRNYATALAAGFMTPNEVRARENLPPSDQPEANMLRFPLASTSGAVGSQLAEDTGAPDDESIDVAEDATKAFRLNGAAHVGA